MIEAGAYADTLRALGRFFDSVRATEVAITEQDDGLHTVWLGQSSVQEARRFTREDIAALRQTARLYRGLEGRTPRFNAAELLRTVGALLDEMGAEAVAITEGSFGFQVTARVNGEQVSKVYTYSHIVTRAQTRYRRGADRSAEA